MGTKRGKLPVRTAVLVPTIGGLFLSSERIAISDQPPPSGNVPPWVAERLAKVRHRATPLIVQPHSISRAYGSSDGTTNQ